MGRAAGIPDVELLLQDRSWACALARSLVHDEHLAEDIVQSAYLATLDKPPPAAAQPRAWFAGVVRNLSRMALRSATRRERRETAAAQPDPVPSAAALAARAEQHHRLAALVLELEEPYRSAILLRYFGDLEPSAIAAQTGEPAATVRSRLKRGLEKLRLRLEESEGSSWRGLLIPLVVDPGGAPAAATVTAGTTMTVAKVLAGSLLLLVFGTGTWLTLRAWTGNGRDIEAPSKAAPAQRHDGESNDRAARPDLPPVRATSFVETDPVPVTGRVVDRLGTPVAGARVIVFPPDIKQTLNAANLDETASGARAGSTDAFGRFEIVPARASGVINLYAECRGWSPVVIESRRPSEDVTVVMEQGARLWGSVSDAEGKPIPGAKIRWHAVICGVSLLREATAGEDGSYEISDVLADGPSLLTSQAPIAEAVVTASGYAPGYLAVPPADDEGRIRLNAVLVPGVSISGTVVDAATSLALVGARVAFWIQREHTSAPGPMGRSLPDPTPVKGLDETTTDTAGRFRFTELPSHDVVDDAKTRGVFGVVGAAARGYSTAIRTVNLSGKEAEGEVVLACARGAQIRGQLVDASGRGLEGVPLWLEPRMATHHFLPPILADERSATTTGALGRFSFEGVRCSLEGSASLEIVGRPRGLLGFPFKHRGVVVRAGETTDVGSIAVGSIASLDVVVTEKQGAPIFGARVSLSPFFDSEDFEGQTVATDSNGRATIHCLETTPGAGHRIARVFAQHPGYARGSAFVTATDQGRELRIVLLPDHHLGGRIVDETGAPVLEAQVWLVDARVPKEQAFSMASELETASQYLPPKFAAVTRTRAGGRFLVRGLAVTRFHVAVRRTGGWARDSTILYDVEADRTDLVVKLPLSEPAPAVGDLEVAISDAETSRPIVDARATVVRPSGGDYGSEGAMGIHRFAGLPVGIYTLTLQAQGHVERTIHDVEIRNGATRLLEVRLERGVSVHGSVSRADGERLSNAVIGLLRDDPIIPPLTSPVGEDGTFVVCGLAPSGQYSVVVVELGLLGPSVFVLPDRRKIALPDDPGRTRLSLQVVQAGIVWVLLEGASDKNGADLLREAHLVVKNEVGTTVFERRSIYRPSVPLSLPPGSYRAALGRGGREIDEKRFAVAAGETLEVKLSLR